MNLHIEFEQEDNGRWIAEIPELPGVLVYGVTKEDATSKVEALAFRVLCSWESASSQLAGNAE
jgi:predicted RNase H-like HicB family nuclease